MRSHQRPRSAAASAPATSHYTRAGSGDIPGINAPQAQFAAVTQTTPTATNHCNPLPAQIITVGTTTPSCYATSDQGFPTGLVTSFNPATDNITWVPKNTARQLRGELLPQRAAAVDQEHSSRRCLRRQSRTSSRRLSERQPAGAPDSRHHKCPAALRQLAQRHHRSPQRVLFQLQRSAGSLRAALRGRADVA